MSNYHNKKLFGGFTVVELLIATAVFSMVLTVGIVGFLQIGKIYHKGITSTRTHETTRDVINSLQTDISFASQIGQTSQQSAGNTSDGYPRFYFCAGQHRYTYVRGKAVNLASWDQVNNFGMIKDEVAVSGGCSPPFGPGSVAFNNPQEIMGNRMRVADFNVTQLNPLNPFLVNLYTIYVKIAYGDDANLQNPTQTNVTCDTSLTKSQYCHVSEIRTTVRRGIM